MGHIEQPAELHLLVVVEFVRCFQLQQKVFNYSKQLRGPMARTASKKIDFPIEELLSFCGHLAL